MLFCILFHAFDCFISEKQADIRPNLPKKSSIWAYELLRFKMSKVNGEIAYNVKGQGKNDTYPSAEAILQKSISYPVSSLMKLTLSFSSYALEKTSAFWVILDYFIRTHFHSPCWSEEWFLMPNSKLNLWALTARARAEQRWKDVMLGKHQNNSDKAICNSRKREHPFHTNTIISPSVSNWERIIHRTDARLCAKLLHLSEGSCTLSVPISTVKPILQKSFHLWPETLEIC